MCRLFGFKSAVLSRAHRSLVAAQNALAVQAREHRDGWGIGYFHGGEAWLLKKEQGAADCESFRRASERLSAHTLLVHVRRATVGSVTPLNVHPFRHGRWLFAHNGTVHGFDKIRPILLRETPSTLSEHILGDTDTETLFHWLLGRLARSGLDPSGVSPVSVPMLTEVLARAQRQLLAYSEGEGVPRPVVNFLLSNGEVFVAQRSGRELHFATQKRMCADAPTCAWTDKVCLLDARPAGRLNHLLVASERIGDEDRWEEVPEGSLLAVTEGGEGSRDLAPWTLHTRPIAA